MFALTPRPSLTFVSVFLLNPSTDASYRGGAVGALRETVKFANLGPGDYDPEVMDGQQPAHAKPAVTTSNPPLWGGTPAPPTRPAPNNVVQAPGIRFELSDGTWVDIQTSSPLTADTMDELNDYLTVYAKVLAKKAKARAGAVPDDLGG